MTFFKKNIYELKPYSSARNEFEGEAHVWLDANENALNNGVNRYPDPYQKQLKQLVGEIKQVSPDSMFLGNGSDEPIDLLIRATCEPGKDKILIFPPTYGMYEVAATINNIETVKINLTQEFDINIDKTVEVIKKDDAIKMVFVCSPNNPTGNRLDKLKIERILNTFTGIVVIDEAYIDFSSESGFLQKLTHYPNLVVLQTFSKAWGMAGIRLGMAFASPEIISVLNKIKPPYNINILTQNFAVNTLKNKKSITDEVNKLIEERNLLCKSLLSINGVEQVYPSDANFLLVKLENPKNIYHYLANNGIVVRDRSSVIHGCLRITIGTSEENQLLLETITKFYSTE